MTADVVILPTVRVERQSDARAAIYEIFGERVPVREIERFLGELHRRGFRVAPFETEDIAP